MPQYACNTCGTIGSRPFCEAHKPTRPHPRPQSPVRLQPPRNGSTWEWRKTRARVLRRDNYVCQLRIVCDGAPATHVDHLHPRDLGGTDEDHNLAAACGPCNRRKGRREPSTPPPATGPPLIVTIGPPAAGKTTWALDQPDAVVLSLDDYRDHGAWTREAHDRATAALLADLARELAGPLSVIVDSTALGARWRRTLRAYAAQHNRPCAAVIFDEDAGTLRQRNDLRPDPADSAMLTRIHRQLHEDRAAIECEPWHAVTTPDGWGETPTSGDQTRRRGLSAKKTTRETP